MSTIQIREGRYYGVADAAEAIGVTVGRIRQMIRWEEIPAIKISSHAWLIAEKDVKEAIRVRENKK